MIIFVQFLKREFWQLIDDKLTSRDAETHLWDIIMCSAEARYDFTIGMKLRNFF